MFENNVNRPRPFYSFRMPTGTELKRGCTDVIVTYPNPVLAGETEVSVAQAKFLRDSRFHHEPVDMFGRQGFSASKKNIEILRRELVEKGFKETKE